MHGAMLRQQAEGINTGSGKSGTSAAAGIPLLSISIAMRETSITRRASFAPPPVEISGLISGNRARPFARIATLPSLCLIRYLFFASGRKAYDSATRSVDSDSASISRQL